MKISPTLIKGFIIFPLNVIVVIGLAVRLTVWVPIFGERVSYRGIIFIGLSSLALACISSAME